MKIAIAQLNYTIGDIDGNASKIIDSINKAKAQRADHCQSLPKPGRERNNRLSICCVRRPSSNCAKDALVEISFVLRRYRRDRGTADPHARRNHQRRGADSGPQGAALRGQEIYLGPPRNGLPRPLERVRICDDQRPQVRHHRGRRPEPRARFRQVGRDRHLDQRPQVRQGRHDLPLRYDAPPVVRRSQEHRAGQSGRRCDGHRLRRHVGRVQQPRRAGADDEAVRGGFPDFRHQGPESSRRGSLDLQRPHADGLSGGALRTPRLFFLKNGYKKACIGLSGGIDSAVVACLAADALGAGNVRALLLPSQFSSDHSVEDAKKLAENLGIEYNVIPITEIYTSVVNTLKPVIGGREFDATEENIQTRIRTVLLMAVQNKTDYILLNSSNKSENAAGPVYAYGEYGGCVQPHGDLYKSEMYDVARYINRTFGNVIPENILDKEPSSELHPGQKDSDILPPYEVVDAILLRMIEEGQHREEIVNAGVRLGSRGEDPLHDHAQREEALPVPARAAPVDVLVRARTADAPDQ